MNRVLDSPISPMDFESNILQQLDKITETGTKFLDQILELGEKLKSFKEAQGQQVQELQNQPGSTVPDWMKPLETKLQEMTKAQQKMSGNIRELEKRRINLQEVMAGKFEDVLKDLAKLKSLTETTKELKPKLDDERKITRDLESQVAKMTQDLKVKLDFLESARKSNQNAIESSLEKFGVPTLTHLIDSEGWLVIQKRDSGPRNEFERGWTEYEKGFGSVDGNFWIGLKKIHELTADGSMELRVEMTDWEGNFVHANYSQFSISNAAELYSLSIGGYSGSAGDAFNYANENQFSTRDRNLAGYSGPLSGGWWKSWSIGNLNGLYYEDNEAKTVTDCSGVYWWTWKKKYSLKNVCMKIRHRK